MTAPYGFRGRIGLILPADNVVIEPELAELGLDGVSFHGFRLTSTRHDEMRRQAVELADALIESGVDAVVYACGETSFSGGEPSRMALSGMIAERCGLPVITATNAMVAAARAAGMTRPALVAPYADPSRAQLCDVLTAEGLPPVASLSHDFREGSEDAREWFETNRVAEDVAVRMAEQVNTDDADGIVISSTNWPTLRHLAPLEERIGKPVVSSNLAIVWWALDTLGAVERPPGLGRLLATSDRSRTEVTA